MTPPGPARYRRATHLPKGVLALLCERVEVTRAVIAHDHDFIELVLVARGGAEHRSILGRRTLKEGDVMLLLPGAWHAYDHPRNLLVYNCLFGSEVIYQGVAGLLNQPGLGRLFWSGEEALEAKGLVVTSLPKPAHRALRAELDKMILDRSQSDTGTGTRMVGRLMVALGILSGVLYPRVDEERVSFDAIPLAAKRAAALLRDQPAHPWTLSELSGRVHAERSHLVRVFKRHTGQTPMAYLIGLRARMAANLLLRTDLPINEVAARVGWSDANYFARRFRAYWGQSAQSYRKRLSATR
ncbi:MAG: helix-turn-helix domain-containing protein [Phycisphaera sp.]|nr:helix-turn-helix domain-containing protein [Phycisphaera sp.]